MPALLLFFENVQIEEMSATSRALRTPEIIQMILNRMERHALGTTLTFSKFWHDNAVYEAGKRHIVNAVIFCQYFKTSRRKTELYCSWSYGRSKILPWEKFDARGLPVIILMEEDFGSVRLP
jgi:hypothetical protein